MLVVVTGGAVVVVVLVTVVVEPATVVVAPALVVVVVGRVVVVVEVVVVEVVDVVVGGTGADSHDDSVVAIFEVSAPLGEPSSDTIRLLSTSSPIAIARARRIPRAGIIKFSKVQLL